MNRAFEALGIVVAIAVLALLATIVAELYLLARSDPRPGEPVQIELSEIQTRGTIH